MGACVQVWLMRPFPAQYTANYAFYGSLGLGMVYRAPKALKKVKISTSF